MYKAIRFGLMGILFLAVGVGSARAGHSIAGVKQRMKARVTAIAKLKTAKAVGEDKQGYLTVLKPSVEVNKLVQAENADRAAVYAFIAAKTGSTAARVGAKRAQAIAGAALPGVMIQARDGTWYEKK